MQKIVKILLKFDKNLIRNFEIWQHFDEFGVGTRAFRVPGRFARPLVITLYK